MLQTESAYRTEGVAIEGMKRFISFNPGVSLRYSDRWVWIRRYSTYLKRKIQGETALVQNEAEGTVKPVVKRTYNIAF